MNPYWYDAKCGLSIYCGDSRKIIQNLEFDAVITDPPYGVLLKEKRAKLSRGGMKLRPGRYSFDDTPDYVASVVIPILEECRSKAKRVALTPGIRNMWLYPEADDVGCVFSPAGTGVGRWGFTCMHPILYYGSDPYLENGRGSRANAVVQMTVNDSNRFDHPCAKPLKMMLWMVDRASAVGDVVLDPFMGSGTTLIAAKTLGRKAIGIELERRFCDMAIKRLETTPYPLLASGVIRSRRKRARLPGLEGN